MNNVLLSPINLSTLELLIQKSVEIAISRVLPVSSIPAEEKFHPLKEAATFLDLADQTMYQKVGRNEIPYIKKHGRLYFKHSDLVEYLNSGRVASRKEIESELN